MPNYSQYNPNFYMQDLQNMRDRIDRTMQQYQQTQANNQQPVQPQIHQNFQLAPMQNNFDLEAKFVTGIDEVKNTFVMRDGIFVNREMNTLWTKNVSGDIKTYSLEEVIEVDPKDVEINNLKKEIANMREMISRQSVKSVPEVDNDFAEVKKEETIVKTTKKTK